MKKLGVVTHYFGNINVAVMNLTGNIVIGDMVIFDGYLTDFEQRVDSMEVDKQPISEAKKGMEIAIKVVEWVRKGDKMFEAGE
jgi:hypothetical protein